MKNKDELPLKDPITTSERSKTSLEISENSEPSAKPLDIPETLQLAEQYFATDQWSEAEKLCNKIIEFSPNHPSAFQMLGLIAYKIGKHDVAADLLRRAVEIQPNWPDAFNNLGIVLQHQGQLEEAITCYERALSLRPQFPEPYSNMGLAFQSQNQLSKAVSCYKQALELKPDYAEAYHNLGNTLRQQNNPIEAAKNYKHAIRVKPEYYESFFNLGIAYEMAGQHQEAITAYRNAIKLKPAKPETYINLGAIYYSIQQIDEAILSYEKASQLGHDSPELHSNLGVALQTKGLFDEALQRYRRALDHNPNYPDALNNLSTALHEIAKNSSLQKVPPFIDDPMGQAISTLRKTISLQNKNAVAHYNLANVLQETGDLEEAVRHYSEAIRIQPNYQEAWHNLQGICRALEFLKWEKSDREDFYSYMKKYSLPETVHLSILEYYVNKFNYKLAEKNYTETVSLLPPIDLDVVAVDKTSGVITNGPPRPKQMVALLHFGRSGTGLLHSLVDGHPEISTIPSIYLRGFFNFGVWQKMASEGWRQLPQKFLEMFAVLFDASSPDPTPGPLPEDSYFLGKKEGMTCVGENRDESLMLDTDQFFTEAMEFMSKFEKLDPKTFLQIIHAVHDKLIGSKTEKHTILYHIHNPSDFAKLNFLRYFPDSRLMMMVREPVECCESWIRGPFQGNEYNLVAHHILEMLHAIDQVPFQHHDSIGIRLEDLKGRHKRTLFSLCQWLGINFDPCLYQMTAQGKKWWGDPTSPDYRSTEAMSPFYQNNTPHQRVPIFGPKDRFVLKTLFYPFSVRFGYQEANPIQFENDLIQIKPLFDDLLDFEKVMLNKTKISLNEFQQSSAYLSLRASFVQRWNLLNEAKDYPHMLTPLDISER